MAIPKIGAAITLDGEKEYRQAIKDINKDMNVLRSEMKATSAQFEGNANSIEALNKKNEILRKEYDEQTKKIKTMNGALADARKTYGENSNQVKDWQIKLNNAYGELSKLDRELKTNEKYLDEAKSSADGTAKSIDEFGKQVKVAGENSEKTGEQIKNGLSSAAVVAGVAALGIAVKKVADATIDLAKGAASYADDILTLSTQTGIATDTLQELKYMQELTDVSLETVTGSMAKQIRSMKQAQDGTKLAVEAYQKLRVEYQNADGSLRDSEQVYWEVVDALGAMKNETERDALAMQLMGRSAQDLNPLIAIGSKGVAEFADEARRVGAVLDQGTLEKLGETDDAFQRMNLSVDIAKRKIGIEMAPVVTQAMDKLTKKVNDMDGGFASFAGGTLNVAVDGLGWIMDNAPMIAGGITGIAAGMAAFKAGTAIQAGLTLAIGSWKAYKSVTEGATVAQWAMNAAQSASPVGLIATAVGVATGALVAYSFAAGSAASATSEFTKEADKNIDSLGRLNQAVKQNLESREDSTNSMEAEYSAAQKLADRLAILAEKEGLTNAEKSEMAMLVEQLNKTIPSLNLTIDEETGLINKQTGEIKQLIQASLEWTRVKAAQDDLLEYEKQKYMAVKQLEAAEKEREETVKRLKAAEDNYYGNQDKWYYDWKGAKEAENEVKAQERALKELDEQIKETKDLVSELTKKIEIQTEYVKENSDALEKNSAAHVVANNEVVIAESELTAEMDRLYKERQKKESASLEHRREMINEHYSKLSEDLDDRIWEERRALEKAQKAQLDSLKAANNQELRLLEEQHNKKLALINKEYLEKIKLVDEERYAALKNIDDEINAIKEKSRQEEAARKAEEEEKKRQELLEKIQNAKSINQYKAAQQELAEFEARLQYERELAEKESQIEILEQRKATINESYDAQIKALQDEQKQKEAAAKQEYEAEKEQLKNILDLKVQELQEKQELEDRAYQKKWNQMKENLRKEKEEAIKNAKEIYDTNLELFKNSEKLKLDAMKSLSEKAIEEQKKIGENLADAMYKGYSERNMAILPLYEKTIDQIPDRTKKILGIQSPSKVFMQLGKFTAEGFELGFKERMAKVNRELSIAMPTVSALTGRNISTVSAPVGGRSTNVTLHIDTFVNNRPEDMYALMTEIDFIARQHAIAGGAK